MNEELKIIIKADADDAKKDIKGVNKELGGMEKQGKKSGNGLSKALKGAGIAATAAAAAVTAVVTALTSLANKTKEFREEQAKLNAAFLAAGSSTEQAATSYKNLYRFLGDSGKATEAAAHLAKLTQNEQHLAEWTTALQGVYATFGDSLPIEGLTEAANETAKVGKVTGVLADALNWAGVSEDAFNTSLAAANSEAEREELIRNTLNGLYQNSAKLYEKNNQEIIRANEAQAKLNDTTARLGKVTQPLQTALTNLSNTLLNAFAPAIEVVAKALTWLIDALNTAFQYVTIFFKALTGKDAEETTENIGSNIDSAAGGANNLASGLGAAVQQAEKLKRATAGFDELNVMQDNTASSGSGGSGSGSGAGIGSGLNGGFTIDTKPAVKDLSEMSKKIKEFADKVKKEYNRLNKIFEEWTKLFTPSALAWKEGFSGMWTSLEEAGIKIKEALITLWEEDLAPFGGYLLNDFVPSITNTFSEEFAPIFTDTMHWAIVQFPKDFEWACNQIGIITEDILKPAFEEVKTTTQETFQDIGSWWREAGANLLEKLSGFIESIKRIWENLYNKILKPIWDKIIGGIGGMWDEHLRPLWQELLSFFGKVGDCIMTLWNNFLAPIINWIITVLAPIVVGVIDTIIDITSTVTGIIAGVIKGILKALGGLLDFITGIFSGDWNKAWTGIKNFFVGIWNAIWSIVKGIINLIIDAINLLWTGIYNVIRGLVNGIGEIAGAIGDLFGKDWHFSMPKEPPKIPKLATGGIVNSATIAMVGERGKEAVLPLENNTEWMDKLADKIAAKNSSPSKIVLMLDSKELGWANIESINGITEQTGQLQLRLV